MKRLALFAAAGLISMLPSIASARPFFFWGFRFGPPVPVVVAPILPPPAVFVAPPAVVAPAPVVVAGPTVVCAPPQPVYYYHAYDYGYRHPYFYRPWGYGHYHYWR
jgi:hypothetical protein